MLNVRVAKFDDPPACLDDQIFRHRQHNPQEAREVEARKAGEQQNALLGN